MEGSRGSFWPFGIKRSPVRHSEPRGGESMVLTSLDQLDDSQPQVPGKQLECKCLETSVSVSGGGEGVLQLPM